MANISVSDGTATHVFVAKTPSSGDKSPAFWRADADAALPLNAPSVSVTAAFNGPRNARQVNVSGSVPYVTLDALGNEVLGARAPFRFDILIPLNVPSAKAAKAAKIVTNLLASTLMNEIFTDGYAAS